MKTSEKQLTRSRTGHVVTNIGAWSPDGQWIVYDTRSDRAGSSFDGPTIEIVNAGTAEVRTVYEAKNGAFCGVATFNPREAKVIFILGPENPTDDWQYGFYHREGVMVDISRPGTAVHFDGRDVVAPYTAGALRGGSHVHVWDPAGQWVSYTYEDHVCARFKAETADNDVNLRNVGVGVPGRPVHVPRTHPRNEDGAYFNVLVTRTTANPKPGSDEISRACEEGWIGNHGYQKADGRWQRHALAFQGTVTTARGEKIVEAFIVDLPDDMTVPGDGPLAGTENRMPYPPRGVVQRRLTHTADRAFPGLQGPRHWLRSSPDGSRIAVLMKDDDGIVQLWTLSPNGGAPTQLTHNRWSVSSTFTWSPDGRHIAHVMDHSVCVTDTRDGSTSRITPRSDEASGPRPEACVFSPDGKKIAFMRRMEDAGEPFNQVFVVDCPR